VPVELELDRGGLEISIALVSMSCLVNHTSREFKGQVDVYAACFSSFSGELEEDRFFQVRYWVMLQWVEGIDLQILL